MEEWRKVQNTNGMIEVSNYGRVRSLLRGKPHILKTQKDSKGYHRVSVTIDGHKTTYKVHRLVAIAFIDNNNNHSQVNHIDGNKDNNNVSNLEWISNRDNAIHAVNNGLWDSNITGVLNENKRRMKAIIGTKDGNVVRFGSISEAEKVIGSRHITDVLKGKRSHVKGWSFSYEKGVMPCQS